MSPYSWNCLQKKCTLRSERNLACSAGQPTEAKNLFASHGIYDAGQAEFCRTPPSLGDRIDSVVPAFERWCKRTFTSASLFLKMFPFCANLIDASVRALQTQDYTPDQIEGALKTVFGVDSRSSPTERTSWRKPTLMLPNPREQRTRHPDR